VKSTAVDRGNASSTHRWRGFRYPLPGRRTAWHVVLWSRYLRRPTTDETNVLRPSPVSELVKTRSCDYKISRRRLSGVSLRKKRCRFPLWVRSDELPNAVYLQLCSPSEQADTDPTLSRLTPPTTPRLSRCRAQHARGDDKGRTTRELARHRHAAGI
jgi:hypothetical protein